MRIATIDAIVTGLREIGVSLVPYLPDSWMAPVLERLRQEQDFELVPVTNEGEAVAMTAGSWLGGRPAVTIMENSGVRVACEELARLGLGQGVASFMMMPFRGDLGDEPHWAQAHAWTMEPVMRALRMSFRVVRDDADLVAAIRGAPATMRGSKNHVAIVLGSELCSDATDT